MLSASRATCVKIYCWTPDQDAVILKAREEGSRWSSAARLLGRTSQQCRDRSMTLAHPNIKVGTQSGKTKRRDRGITKMFIRKGMENLAGQGTLEALFRVIPGLPEFQQLEDQIARPARTSGHSFKTGPAWKVNIRTHIVRYCILKTHNGERIWS